MVKKNTEAQVLLDVIKARLDGEPKTCAELQVLIDQVREVEQYLIRCFRLRARLEVR